MGIDIRNYSSWQPNGDLLEAKTQCGKTDADTLDLPFICQFDRLQRTKRSKPQEGHLNHGTGVGPNRYFNIWLKGWVEQILSRIMKTISSERLFDKLAHLVGRWNMGETIGAMVSWHLSFLLFFSKQEEKMACWAQSIFFCGSTMQ